MATQTHYIIPGLGKLWESLGKYAWAFLRIAYGAWYIPHGMQKLFGAFSGNAKFIAGLIAKAWGWEQSTALTWVYIIGSVEFFGGILLVIGLFTRPVAVAFCIFMYVAAFHFNSLSGYWWTRGGMEMPLLLLAVAIAILVRGGGEYSLDRKWGREF